MWASLKPRRGRVLAHARRLGRHRVCGAAFGRSRDQVWQEPATTRRKDRKLGPTPIGGPPRVVGMRWNQPWNFSRLLKHLTEHRMLSENRYRRAGSASAPRSRLPNAEIINKARRHAPRAQAASEPEARRRRGRWAVARNSDGTRVRSTVEDTPTHNDSPPPPPHPTPPPHLIADHKDPAQ
jgi:hypothetical protein